MSASGGGGEKAKRLLVLLSVGALSILVPTYPLIALAIAIDPRGPIHFRSRRLGRHGRPFTITKFRTMVVGAPEQFNADGSRYVAERDPRITRVGRVLRGGLDELPQVFAVLTGKMSFVGPRPDDLYALGLYRGAEWARLSALPGLTGLAQVSGRNDIPWRERLKLDVYYALESSLRLDLAIILRTVMMAFGRRQQRPLVAQDEVERVFNSDRAAALASSLEQSLCAHATIPPPDPAHRRPAVLGGAGTVAG